MTSKTALGPVTGVNADKNGGSNGAGGVGGGVSSVGAQNCGSLVTVDQNNSSSNNNGGGGGGGFNSLPSSIHHGLSERLQGLTEKLHSLGGNRSQDSDGVRSRTGTNCLYVVYEINHRDILPDILFCP